MLRFKKPDGSDYPALQELHMGDITTEYNVRNKSRLPLDIYSVNNTIGFLPQSEQFDDAGYLHNTDTSIYMIVPNGYFAYNPARIDIGSIGYQNTGHDVQVSSLYVVFNTSDRVNDEYLWHWFHTKHFRNSVRRLQEGGVRLYYYYDKLDETKISLPCLEEQEIIADCLSSVDDVIADYEAQVENMQNQKKGVMQRLFSQEVRFKADDGSEYPMWSKVKFKDIAELHARIGWQNLRKEEFLEEGDYYLFTGTDFSSGTINLETCHYIDKERYDQDPHIQVREGTILITKDGTLGKVAMVPQLDRPATLNAGVFAVQDVKDDVDNKYLYHYLAAPFLLAYAAETSTGGTIKHLNQGVLVEFPIPVPCLEEQQRIADCLTAFDDAIEDLQKTVEHWKNIKKGLLQQLFA